MCGFLYKIKTKSKSKCFIVFLFKTLRHWTMHLLYTYGIILIWSEYWCTDWVTGEVVTNVFVYLTSPAYVSYNITWTLLNIQIFHMTRAKTKILFRKKSMILYRTLADVKLLLNDWWSHNIIYETMVLLSVFWKGKNTYSNSWMKS